jgi:hypothetical protein
MSESCLSLDGRQRATHPFKPEYRACAIAPLAAAMLHAEHRGGVIQ